MKKLLPAALSCLLAVLCACSKADSNKPIAVQAKDSAADAKANLQDAWAHLKVSLSDTWDKIKDYSYQEKGEFCKNLDQMSRDLDDQAAKLRAKVSSASDSGSGAASQAKEKAREDYEKARDNLKEGLNELGNATADGWASAKAKVSEEWKKMQDAWDREQKADAGS